MNKAHIENCLEEYLQGGMDHAARAGVEGHLAVCRGCRQALESAQDAIAVMRWLPNPEAPPQPGPDFYYRVQASIAQQQSQGWLVSLTASLQPRLALPFAMMAMLLLAWMITLPQRDAAVTAQSADALREVEYPSADFAQMTYSDDRDEARHDRMMDEIFDAPDIQ